jgi:hypothetical protein
VEESSCDCTRSDFECDFNYFMNHDGVCVLGSSMQPPPPTCVDGIKRHSVGYRKKQISSCSGGVEAELQGKLETCGMKSFSKIRSATN